MVPSPYLFSISSDWCGSSHHYSRHLYGHLSRGTLHQCQPGAEDHDPGTDPDPQHHRIHVSFDNRMTFITLAFVNQIQVFFKALIDVGLARGLTAGLVKDA